MHDFSSSSSRLHPRLSCKYSVSRLRHLHQRPTLVAGPRSRACSSSKQQARKPAREEQRRKLCRKSNSEMRQSACSPKGQNHLFRHFCPRCSTVPLCCTPTMHQHHYRVRAARRPTSGARLPQRSALEETSKERDKERQSDSRTVSL